MRGGGVLVVLVVSLALVAQGALAADRSATLEIASLKARVAELEAQNEEILALLRALRDDRLEAAGSTGGPAPAVLRGTGGAAVAAVAPSAAVPAASPASGEPAIPRQVTAGRDSRVGFYGFIRLDAIFDDSRPSAIQTPTFILPEPPGARDRNSFNIHPRLSRFGFDYDGPRIGGFDLGAKIEIDFQNGGGEARQLMRMRHAYMTLDWQHTRLLVGQTWDLISPLYPTVNADTLMWNTGNLGDRRPQVRGRLTRETDGGGRFSFEGGLGLSGAIDRQDLDDNGIRDGDDGLFHNLQARVAWSRAQGSGSWTLGLHGLVGREQTDVPIGGRDTFDSHVIGLDFAGKWGRVGLKGEAWTGRNLDDFRGGIGQGVNPATGRAIKASGGWLELGLDVNETFSFFVGYSFDDPSNGDVPAGGRTRNEAFYLVNRFQVARPFQVGIDYLLWETSFKGLAKGDDNRLNLYLIYTF